MNIPYVMRQCTKCGRWLVASEINFYKQKYGKYKLGSRCKECEKKRRKQYREDNREKEVEWHKKYYEANRDKILEQHKQYREANRDKVLEHQRQHYKANREKIGKRHKQYYEANRDKELERHKRRYKDNKEKILEQCKQYHQSPQGQVVAFNKRQRRRAKEQQGDGITKDQWLEMMKYFDWECAYSGERLTDKTRSIDHIVPLNSGGDNMIWNCVPMKLNYNSSKHAKDMLEWYREQDFYSEDRLAKIYKWQEYARKKWEN